MNKEKFLTILNRALPKYVPSKPQKDVKARSDDYSGKKTHQRRPVNTSG